MSNFQLVQAISVWYNSKKCTPHFDTNSQHIVPKSKNHKGTKQLKKPIQTRTIIQIQNPEGKQTKIKLEMKWQKKITEEL